MPITSEEIKRLRKLHEKATPPDWELATSNSHRRIGRVGGQDGGILYGYVYDGAGDLVAKNQHDLILIPEVRNALGSLIDEIERLQEFERLVKSDDYELRE